MPEGNIDLLVLAVLSHEPAHGFAIIETIRSRSGGALDFPEGTIYPLLHKLERDNLVVSEWAVADGRRRRVYHLTERGEGRLGEKARLWRSLQAAFERILPPTDSRKEPSNG
jgi:DNA-binding PadR family transcriptional regulator